jgi:hypothetical protein
MPKIPSLKAFLLLDPRSPEELLRSNSANLWARVVLSGSAPRSGADPDLRTGIRIRGDADERSLCKAPQLRFAAR